MEKRNSTLFTPKDDIKSVPHDLGKLLLDHKQKNGSCNILRNANCCTQLLAKEKPKRLSQGMVH
jgi:hypothetical protein